MKVINFFGSIIHFTHGWIHGNRNLCPRFKTRGADSCHYCVNSFLITLNVRGKSPFITNISAVAFFLQH